MPNEDNIKEQRDMRPEDVEMRLTDDGQPKIKGYAARFGNFYDLGWFRERIKAGAFDEAMKDADVRCLVNHDSNLILGRTSSGTLRLQTNSVGLQFEDDLPDTATGKDTRELIRRGDLSGCSFAFTVAEDDWKYFDDDRQDERTIVKIGQLFDVGPVTYPANPATSVSARADTTVARRSLDAFKERNKVSDERPAAEERTEEKEGQEDPKPEEKPAEELKYIDDGQMRRCKVGYRHMQRILNRNKVRQANA